MLHPMQVIHMIQHVLELGNDYRMRVRVRYETGQYTCRNRHCSKVNCTQSRYSMLERLCDFNFYSKLNKGVCLFMMNSNIGLTILEIFIFCEWMVG